MRKFFTIFNKYVEFEMLKKTSQNVKIKNMVSFSVHIDQYVSSGLRHVSWNVPHFPNVTKNISPTFAIWYLSKIIKKHTIHLQCWHSWKTNRFAWTATYFNLFNMGDQKFYWPEILLKYGFYTTLKILTGVR